MAKGLRTKADMDNHANQMNPNNWRYHKARQHHTEEEDFDDYDDCEEEDDDNGLDEELEEEWKKDLEEEARQEITWTIQDYIDYYGGWQDDW